MLVTFVNLIHENNMYSESESLTLSIFELHAAFFSPPPPPRSHRNSFSGQKYYVVPNPLLSYPPSSDNKEMEFSIRIKEFSIRI